MAKKTCSKGHIYDSSIYGDNCPFCPSQGSGTVVCENGGEAGGSGCAGGTEVNQEGRTSIGGVSTNDPTIPLGGGIGGGTVIRSAAGTGNAATPSGKRIVGIIVTYDVLSTGQVHNIFEGRNYIGREVTSDICIQGDGQISGKHFSILYRPIDGKFKFKDEQSSNGTFVNEQLTDEGELSTFDIIRVGSTRLIFIAIPQLV